MKADWEKIEQEYRAGNGYYRTGEAGAVQVIKLLLSVEGAIEDAFDLPKVVLAENEFRLPRGIADFVFFHVDGSASVLEVKDVGGDRDVLAGVGQLMSYAVQLGYSRTIPVIRRILVVPVKGKDATHFDEVCRLAGVVFVPLGSVMEHEQIWQEEVARGEVSH